MAKFNMLFFVISSIMIFIQCAVVTVPNKCKVTDGNCKKLMYQKMFRQMADGAPSANIPKSDPIELQKMYFSLPNSVKLTLDIGVMSGVKTCNFDEMETILEEPFHSTLNITCNIEINGKFTVDVPKSVIKKLGGETDGLPDITTGKARGKIVMEKLHLHLLAPFEFERKDKDIYLHSKPFEMNHAKHYNGHLSIDDLDIGNTVNSDMIANYLKDHAVELNLVSPVTAKICDLFQVFVDFYVSKVPAKDLYATDISSFI